jgi:GT2 family glycosyltransferase
VTERSAGAPPSKFAVRLDRPSVTAVVLNFQSASSTIRCVESLLRISYSSLSILVVDNNSSDDSVAAIRARHPRVPLVQSQQNLGYGFGNNCGIRAAITGGADFVWLVTPDVEVEPSSLKPLLELMSDEPRVGIAGSLVHAGELCIIRSQLTPALGFLPRHFVVRNYDLRRPERPIVTDFVDGCAMFLRSALIREIGLLRDDWFLYFEETEYCLRAREHGWEVRLAPNSDVRTRAITQTRNERAYFMIRNSILLARTRRKHRLRTVARHLTALAFHLTRVRRNPEYDSIGTTVRAIRTGLRKPLAPIPFLD